MARLNGFADVVYPAKDLAASVAGWRAVLDQDPAFTGAGFAVFTGQGAEVGLSSAPWVTTRWCSGRADLMRESFTVSRSIPEKNH